MNEEKSIFLIITFVFMLTTLLSGCTGNGSLDEAPEVDPKRSLPGLTKKSHRKKKWIGRVRL